MPEQNKNKVTENVNRPSRFQQCVKKCSGTLRFSFIFASAIHITKIVIAAIYFHKCPVEPEIPKYLLVMGIIGVVTKLIMLFRNFIIKCIKVTPILSLLATVELTIFIIGSYYIYREFEPSYEPQSGEKYCDKTLYLFSFIYITIIYALLLLAILIVSCFILAVVLLDKLGPKERTHDAENTTEIPLATEQGSTEK
ncbi:hypothetical protein Zmor_014767 [Zophobas morio]|uniref:Uncharacterized protein n=1 Tax=Zophobas morio TaxID=2755281 RepID=A0AA38IKA1_9CUCU|nr:hypothetical protein Zmor_014767 [Zophobas morio]